MFEGSYQETYYLVERNLFAEFIQDTSASQVLKLARNEALWFLPANSVLMGDGHTKSLVNNKMTLARFFSFPDPVVEADSQLNSFITMNLVIIYTLIDMFLGFSFPWLYFFLVWGFLARMSCGPRLSFLAYFNLFIFEPFVLRYFAWAVKKICVPGPPKRFAQFCGFCISVIAVTLRLVDQNLYYNPQYNDSISTTNIAHRPYLIASISLWCLMVFVCILNSFFCLCIGCVVYGYLVDFGIFEQPCEMCYRITANSHNSKMYSTNENNDSNVSRNNALEDIAEGQDLEATSSNRRFDNYTCSLSKLSEGPKCLKPSKANRSMEATKTDPKVFASVNVDG
eukprot:Pgem_evm1s1811